MKPFSIPNVFILHPSSFILHPSSFILHPSSFILHPSSFILHPMVLTPQSKKLLHQFSAFVFQHSSRHFNPMIQKLSIANPEARFDCAGPFIRRSVNQSFYSCLNQRSRAHRAGLNRGVDDCSRQPIVAYTLRRLPQGNNLRVRRRIQIGTGSVAGIREDLISPHNARSDWDFTTLLSLTRGCDCLAHPIRIVSFILNHNERRPAFKQRKL
jgi:hypothetical protein